MEIFTGRRYALPMENISIPSVHIKDFEPISADILNVFPEGLVKKNMIVPLAKRDGRVVAAVPRTSGLVKPEGLKLLAGCPVDIVLAPTEEIIAFIKLHYPNSAPEQFTTDVLQEPARVEEMAPAAVAVIPMPQPTPPPVSVVLPSPIVPVPVPASVPVPVAAPAPVTNGATPALFSRIVAEVVQNHAVEALFDVKGEVVRVRHRTRGVVAKPANMLWTKTDIANVVALVRERGENHSADGVKWSELQINIANGAETYDCVFNLTETSNLTLVTVKVEQHTEQRYDLLGWGLDALQAKTLEELLAKEQGVILFCGAEQDGAQATLNACVRKLAVPEKHVICVESYIDQWIQDADQFNAKGNPSLFTQYLQTALAHSPDILKVRPMDSRAAWELCLREALRGPLILGGAYARDAAEALAGIVRMGVDPALVSSGLLAVVTQRKLRLNCQHCQQKETVHRERLREIGVPVELQPTAFFYGAGCESCHKTGFGNETHIFEVMVLNDDVKNGLTHHVSAEKIRMSAKMSGTLTLRQVAVHKAIAGQTSLAEVVRVSPK